MSPVAPAIAVPMDCQSLASDVANAFAQVFDAGMGYGALILLAGVFFGYCLGKSAS